MSEPNAATMIADLLKGVRSGAFLHENGTYYRAPQIELENTGGVKRDAPKTLRTVLALHGAGAFATLEALVAVGSTLNWLIERAATLPPGRRARIEASCAKVKARLEWEFGDLKAADEPKWNVDALISDFENLAIDLDDAGGFDEIDEETIAGWEEALTELNTSIAEGDLPHTTRALFQDVVVSLRTAVRNLRRFGTAACEKDLKDALGRIVNAVAVVPDSEEKTSFIKRAGVVFGQIKDAVSTIQGAVAFAETIHKALMR